VSPFIGRLDDISTDGLALIEEISHVYGLQLKFTASVRHTMHCELCKNDVMTGPLSAIYGLLKHPLTDIGLAQFVADFEKEISNYFYTKSKRPISIEMGLFILMYFVSNKWRSSLLDTSPNRCVLVCFKTFHDYSIVIIDEFTFCSIIQLDWVLPPQVSSSIEQSYLE
jgi:hypothetical protein